MNYSLGPAPNRQVVGGECPMTYTVSGGTLNATHSLIVLFLFLCSNRQHYEIDDCLEDSREDYYNQAGYTIIDTYAQL